MSKSLVRLFSLSILFAAAAAAQDATGTLEGRVLDASSAPVAQAEVTVRNTRTSLARTSRTSREGAFQMPNLPVGDYRVEVSANGFATFTATVGIDVGRIASLPVMLQVAGGHTEVNVAAERVLIDTSQTIGNTVSSGEAADLPLNGRDLTQLGLLQPGVAPVTAGLVSSGGIARAGQAFAVNGQRPESNNYLLDGAPNVDRVNGGYALRVPVDAVSEFRILTLNAPAEFGSTSGATAAAVTKSGGNAVHGVAYNFLRNNALDARNFFAATAEPLHRNQYGGTLGAPLRKDKDFFFVYYEGQRDSEGKTQAAIVPTAAERIAISPG